jgi:hypothetical protein
MYRSRLVPRAIPLLGLIGAPLLIASTIAAFFGVIAQLSAWSAIATLPVALWELSLGLWLTFKGFTASPVTAGMTAPPDAPSAGTRADLQQQPGTAPVHQPSTPRQRVHG